LYFTVGLDRIYKIRKKYRCVPNVISHLLGTGRELVEPHENEQAEVSVPENVFFVFLK
jgi:DNA-binding transcriptional regulator YiaG